MLINQSHILHSRDSHPSHCLVVACTTPVLKDIVMAATSKKKDVCGLAQLWSYTSKFGRTIMFQLCLHYASESWQEWHFWVDLKGASTASGLTALFDTMPAIALLTWRGHINMISVRVGSLMYVSQALFALFRNIPEALLAHHVLQRRKLLVDSTRLNTMSRKMKYTSAQWSPCKVRKSDNTAQVPLLSCQKCNARGSSKS